MDPTSALDPERAAEALDVIATLAREGDGLPRPLPPGAAALIGGRRAPLLNPVHLEHLRIDLTGHPGARPGDEVVLIGRQGDVEITLDEVMQSWRMDATT